MPKEIDPTAQSYGCLHDLVFYYFVTLRLEMTARHLAEEHLLNCDACLTKLALIIENVSWHADEAPIDIVCGQEVEEILSGVLAPAKRLVIQ
ncbi:MAG: hypothetical protein HYR55_05685 [Acidobacteria bacterium]|nr:hypothetical protein [Acidobacteriota bacterium]MBI3656506.1 hypothetical protein [Acidobacteriota bacterium]